MKQPIKSKPFTEAGVDYLQFKSCKVTVSLYEKFQKFAEADRKKHPESVEFVRNLLPWVDGLFYKSQSLPLILAFHHIGDVIHRLDIPMCNNACTRKMNQLVLVDMIEVDNGVLWLTERGEIWKDAYIRYLEFFTEKLTANDLNQNPHLDFETGYLVGIPSWNATGTRSEGSKQKLMYQFRHMENLPNRVQNIEAFGWLFTDCIIYRSGYLRKIIATYP